METLTALQNRAFLAIGPARIAALSILSLLRNEARTEEDIGVINKSKARMENAQKMLSVQLPQMLADLEHTLPAALDEQRIACIEEITPITDAIAAYETDRSFSAEQLDTLSDHCLQSLEPHFTDFLDQMTTNLIETHAQRRQSRQGEMLNAITNAESVGRHIQLIAFNASIEAARIGDLGKGFTVIANEIRQLSGQTQILLDDIADLLRSA